MKVYAETSWMLDIVFQQERFEGSNLVLSLAQERKIELCLPEIIVWEGNQKVERRNAQRRNTIDLLHKERREFTRSQNPLYLSRSEALRVEIQELTRISVMESEHFDELVEELLPIARWLHLDQNIWVSLPNLQEEYELTRMDALIYATIRADAVANPDVERCFISYDQVFDKTAIKRDMNSLGITPLASTDAVTGFLQNRLDA
jgi:hypothetical protein